MVYKNRLIAAAVLLGSSFNVNASLAAYTSSGESLVYSSISNITWTGDANLLGTLMSTHGFNTIVNAIIDASPVIYDTPNLYDTPTNSGSHILSASDFSSGTFGYTNWFGAKAFASYLNSINYGGTNKWTLPSTGSNPYAGYNQTISQLGQLYYNELNALAYPGTNGNDYGILGSALIRKGNVGSFTNVQSHTYWSNGENATIPHLAWGLDASTGYQNNYIYKDDKFYVWAVSPGQVTTVPAPSSTNQPGNSCASTVTAITEGIPVVTLSTPQPNAAETGPINGRFQIDLDAPRAQKVVVSYTISGSALNGKDYKTIKKSVLIPAGTSSAYVDISPINDRKKETTETVTININPTSAYTLSTSTVANISIADND